MSESWHMSIRIQTWDLFLLPFSPYDKTWFSHLN
jgi:hypothetical protein